MIFGLFCRFFITFVFVVSVYDASDDGDDEGILEQVSKETLKVRQAYAEQILQAQEQVSPFSVYSSSTS